MVVIGQKHRTLYMRTKVHPITCHEGPEGEYGHNPTLSLTSALDGVYGQCHASTALPPGKTRYPLYKSLGRPHVRSGRVRKFSTPAGARSQDCTSRSKSLCRLSYPGPHEGRSVFHIAGSGTIQKKRCLLP